MTQIVDHINVEPSIPAGAVLPGCRGSWKVWMRQTRQHDFFCNSGVCVICLLSTCRSQGAPAPKLLNAPQFSEVFDSEAKFWAEAEAGLHPDDSCGLALGDLFGEPGLWYERSGSCPAQCCQEKLVATKLLSSSLSLEVVARDAARDLEMPDQ